MSATPNRLPRSRPAGRSDKRATASSPDRHVESDPDLRPAFERDFRFAEFIDDASHELRTPVTTIRMMVDLMESECSDRIRKEYWTVLRSELERLSRLIEDMTALGGLTRRSVQPAPSAVTVGELLDPGLRGIAATAASKGISLRIGSFQNLPPVRGHACSLQQAFAHLLDNAAKFTGRDGLIVVSGRIIARSVEISIRDSGIGIPPAEQKNLFKLFFRGRDARLQKIPGSGLGLYLAHGIVARQRGSIRVNSSVGRGTLFKVRLPIAPSS